MSVLSHRSAQERGWQKPKTQPAGGHGPIPFPFLPILSHVLHIYLTAVRGPSYLTPSQGIQLMHCLLGVVVLSDSPVASSSFVPASELGVSPLTAGHSGSQTQQRRKKTAGR